MSKNNSASTSADEQTPPPTIVAWLIRVICILALAGLLGFFLYHALDTDRPIQFENMVDNKQSKIVNNQLHVKVKTINNGSISAEQVVIKLEAPQTGFSQQQVIKILGPYEEIFSTFIIDPKVSLDSVQLTVTSYISS